MEQATRTSDSSNDAVRCQRCKRIIASWFDLVLKDKTVYHRSCSGLKKPWKFMVYGWWMNPIYFPGEITKAHIRQQRIFILIALSIFVAFSIAGNFVLGFTVLVLVFDLTIAWYIYASIRNLIIFHQLLSHPEFFTEEGSVD